MQFCNCLGSIRWAQEQPNNQHWESGALVGQGKAKGILNGSQRGTKGPKMEAKDLFWGAQMQLNGLNCEPEAPRKEPLGVLGRMSEQPERPSSKNLKKDTLRLTIFPHKIHQKTLQKHTKINHNIGRKKYTIFLWFFTDFATFFSDFSKQFFIEFQNLEKIPHLRIHSKILEWIKGRGSKNSLKLTIQTYWKSIQKAIQLFNDFLMILEGFWDSF